MVELLVVISIVAVLVSILIPALGLGRESARSSVCLSNLRQAGVATALYQNEHMGFFPHSVSNPGSPEPWLDFGVTLSAITTGDQPRDLFGGPDGNAGLLQTGKAFLCPSASQNVGYRHYGTMPLIYTDYDRVVDPAVWKRVKMMRIDALKRTSEIISMFDAPQNFKKPVTDVAYGNSISTLNRAFTNQSVYETQAGPLYHNYYTAGATDNDDPIPAPPNTDFTSSSANNDQYNLRFRHTFGSTGNGLYTDGHAGSHKMNGGVLYRNLRPDAP